MHLPASNLAKTVCYNGVWAIALVTTIGIVIRHLISILAIFILCKVILGNERIHSASGQDLTTPRKFRVHMGFGQGMEFETGADRRNDPHEQPEPNRGTR